MSAGKYSFIIEQGSTVNFGINYQDSTGSAISLANYSAKMQIRPTIASTEIYSTLSSSLYADNTGINMSGSSGAQDPASGSIGIFMSATSSSLLNFVEAVYDLEITSGSVVTRILEGKIQLSKEVTR